ncbi:MAG: alpha-glucan family phosphorylase [Bacillota bacterium]
MPGTRYTLEVHATLPPALSRLTELAGNLIYSWDRQIRGLFYFIDPDLWASCEHNPKVFLRRVSQQRLDQLAVDPAFLHQYADVLTAYERYLAQSNETLAAEGLDIDHGQVAYFCMEYGLHESLRLYSGGLGVLAGDYCKAASDLSLPFVAVGLMYHLGYFTQTIDADGEQQAHYQPADLEDLPVEPALDAAGTEIRVHITVANRDVAARVWKVAVGHVQLLLLDTDVPENTSQDRSITYQLYGGDDSMRIAQEIVLGIGGVRALRALGFSPSVWHINEGHAAFLILERCREHAVRGLDWQTSIELVAAETVFTTHTPVPAGHDVFSRELMLLHFERFAEELGVSFDRLFKLGASPQNHDSFNMTALALRGSRRHNGVSRVHHKVAARMEGYVWPQVPPEENPIEYVNNGVHVPTFLARRWVALLDEEHPEWRRRLTDLSYWPDVLRGLSDRRFWDLRQALKCDTLRDIRSFIQRQYQRNNVGRLRTETMLRALDDSQANTLLIGFARRFATYKRALLLFQDAARLAKLLNDPERPVIVLFSGKAHPQDRPAQEIIKELNRYTQDPEFAGKVFFIEGHDIALERKLVTGVDLWLNTPAYPQEASGTSGQKAAVNGVINLSVLDGWWDEGYDGSNGWAIPPHDPSMEAEHRNHIEAEELLDILQREVVPLYYRRGTDGLPSDWIRMSKHSMESILPRYNSQRMVMEYLRRFYIPAFHQGRDLAKDDALEARELAAWKGRVRERWPHVNMHWLNAPPTRMRAGERLSLVVAAELDGLEPVEICVECRLENSDSRSTTTLAFEYSGKEGNTALFKLEIVPPANGLIHLTVRAYPVHPLLAHRFEMGCMLWL